MNTVEILRSAGQYDWGTIPQWLAFASSFLTFIAVVVGFLFTRRQLKHNQFVRETENILSVSDSTIVHNAHFGEKALALKAIEMLEGLNVPANEPDAAMYFATRAVLMSHLNLIWRVWELAKRPGRGEAIDPRYDGWERFAREIVMKKLRGAVMAVKNGGTSPDDLAASDIWSGLSKYEIVPTKFVKWLDGLEYATRRPNHT